MEKEPGTTPTRPPGTPRRWADLFARVLAALALLLGGVSLAVSITDTDSNGKPDTITFHVNEAAGDARPTTEVEVPAAAVQDAKVSLESGLRDETPAEAVIAAPEQIKQNQDTADQVRDDLEPLPTAGATAGFKGCVTRFVNNQSSRFGVRPIWQVLHYTVSPNRPGWSDVWAVVYRFDVLASQASSNFVIDAEGNCAYIVPIEAKPWTQAAGNKLSVAFEIINSGSESQFMASAGYAKLRAVTREVSRRTGIPMRKGSVYPAKSGFVQHKDGGLAWGGHVDITPFSADQVIKILTTNPCGAGCRERRQRAVARTEHVKTHGRLRDLGCARPARRARHPEACRKLRETNSRLHRVFGRTI